MKNKILALLVLSVVFLSCSDNDDNSLSSGNLIGKWGYYQVSTDDNLIESYNTYPETLTFLSNGTFINEFDSSNLKITGNWSLNGDKLELEASGFSNTFTINFICNGNVFKQSEDGNSGIFDYFERDGYNNDSCDEDKF